MEESGLFDLIKTLGKGERRYFKSYAGVGSHAVQLFDALEQADAYNVDDFRKLNKHKPFYKNLASEKQHLLKLLLQSLNEYHRYNNARKQIHFHIDSFELLFQKRQYRLSEKQLKQALKLSEEFHYTIYTLEIYRLFGKLYQHSGNYVKMEVMLKEVDKLESGLCEQITHEFKLKMIEFRSFSTSRKIGYPRTEKEKKVYESLLQDGKQLKRSRPALQEELSWLTIKNYYYDTLPDKEPLMQVRRKWLETAEKDSAFISENAMQYLVGLNNIANSYDELGMEKELHTVLQKVQSYMHKNLDEKIRTFIYYYNLKLVSDISIGRFSEAVASFPEAERGLEQYGRWFHPEYKLGFRYLFAYGYFGVGKFKESLKWTNEMIHNYPKETLEEYYNFSRIFILLIYFELGHDILLTSELRSAKRYLEKRAKLHVLERVFMEFIRNAVGPEGIVATRKDFVALKEKISEIRKSPYETQLFALFDWEAWADSKAKGISLGESIRKLRKN